VGVIVISMICGGFDSDVVVYDELKLLLAYRGVG
jgi:hypothetical protein